MTIEPVEIRKVGIVGAGTMGIGISCDLLLHNFEVVLVDIKQTILENAKEEIFKNIRFAPLLNKNLTPIKLEDAINRLTLTTSIRDVHDCDFIIENVDENIEIKRKVYEDLERFCKKETCFGVDTSCISITEIANYTKRPEQVIGMHFMNPSFLKSVIETIRGFHTSDETIKCVKSFLSKLNKEMILVNDLPGFVSNRISHLFMNEAAFVVQDQIANPEHVDKIFRECFSHKMGPLETADLIGLDTVVNSLDVLYNSYQDPKYRCCPLLKKMVNAGLLGKKTKQGFYKY